MMRNRKTTKIDSLSEREMLYNLMKKRIAMLIEKEKSEGLTPELRESISVANSLLREIRLESTESEFDREHLFEETFGDWLAKVEANKKVKQESEGTE